MRVCIKRVLHMHTFRSNNGKLESNIESFKLGHKGLTRPICVHTPYTEPVRRNLLIKTKKKYIFSTREMHWSIPMAFKSQNIKYACIYSSISSSSSFLINMQFTWNKVDQIQGRRTYPFNFECSSLIYPVLQARTTKSQSE